MIKTPLKLMRKSMTTPLFFLSIILINYILLFLFILPYTKELLWFGLDTSAFSIAIFFFLMSQVVDPGYLKRP